MSCLSPRCDHGKAQVGYVETGTGETVLLLHGSASSSAMWRKAIGALQPLYRTVAPDLIGYGQSAPWTGGAAFTLDAERRALKSLLPCCERFHLVGYSYGGAVALQMALHNPVRVNTLTCRASLWRRQRQLRIAAAPTDGIRGPAGIRRARRGDGAIYRLLDCTGLLARASSAGTHGNVSRRR